MQEQTIGRVISIDSFRVVIELDDSVKTLFKSGFNDIYEIARINSYVSIPVGAEKIISMITKVKINDETEFDALENSILLPKSNRYIVATMIGTINNDNRYIQGVYNFPILDNPVCYVLRKDLEIIFDYKPKESDIDLKRDYYLPIGSSPVFSEFDIKINPDKFFSKHVAVLGNTGSGKSSTIASIFQSMFKGEFKVSNESRKLTDAHVVIFDTNGEYRRAFQFEDEELKSRVNTFTIKRDGLRVPYWFMNYEDFDYLFEPSYQTQAPILKRSIALAKNYELTNSSDVEKAISEPVLNKILRLIDLLQKNDRDMKHFLLNELDDLINTLQDNEDQLICLIVSELNDLRQAKETGNLRDDYGIKGDVSSVAVDTAYTKLNTLVKKIIEDSKTESLLNEKDIDLPVYFNFSKIITEFIDEAIDEIGSSQAKYKEFLSSLKLRLSSYNSDERISIPFMLGNEDIGDSLAKFLTYVLGGIFEQEGSEDQKSDFENYRFKVDNVNNPDKKSQVTILDMSLLPFEVLENITGLIGRLLLEFVQRIEKVDEYKEFRGKYPISIVLEEAHNYIPQLDRKKDRVSISKRVFERIAKEGRKYGLSLIISSQRPSELSKTILSQCNSFIVHRLQNPEDQNFVRQMVSSANADILSQLPILPQQHAIFLGDAVKSPTQVRLYDVNPSPDSNDPEFFSHWMGINRVGIDVKSVTKKWTGSE
ncbi:ATP-binding protein [Aquibacillus kalidii]|uniref:ATP-binding protein n=1 Tax=Aquibacillus kalidii TaxID=2762597 RepID=UPI001647B360|nr:DUF87 domain-containing protein [Aquibacillus kalidii]